MEYFTIDFLILLLNGAKYKWMGNLIPIAFIIWFFYVLIDSSIKHVKKKDAIAAKKKANATKKKLDNARNHHYSGENKKHDPRNKGNQQKKKPQQSKRKGRGKR